MKILFNELETSNKAFLNLEEIKDVPEDFKNFIDYLEFEYQIDISQS
jgi:hypothetical protein